MNFFKKNNLTPRQIQIESITKIINALNSGKRFVLLSAPVGVGKQFIAQAIAESARNAHIITSSKQLQDQYKNPGGVVDLRGKGNYKCGINQLMTCESAPCAAMPQIIRQCQARQVCPYINQRNKAMEAPVMLTNYAYYLFARLCGPLSDEKQVTPREVCIMDEAHALEGYLVGFAEIILKPAELKERYGISDLTWFFNGSKNEDMKVLVSMTRAIMARKAEWTKDRDNIYADNGIDENTPMQNISKPILEKINKISAKVSDIDKVVKKLEIYFERRDLEEWIVESNADENHLTITPLSARGLFQKFIGESASKFVFMSATIGSAVEFARELALPADQVEYIEVDSPFSPDMSPIIVLPIGKMNYQNITATLPKIADAVDHIMDHHKTEKGIIHSVNYRITDDIAKRVKRNRSRLLSRGMDLVNFKFGIKNDVLIKKHMESRTPTVLLSPSMSEGISLDDDLARFQIIVKLPFASMADPRVKAKMKEGKWYVNQMLKEIMQASGRATRSEEDHSVTYVLDSSFPFFIEQCKNELPKWFVDRIQM